MTNRPSDRIENAVLANVSDVVHVPVAESDLPAAESAGEAQLESTLRISFEAEPLEDGMNHLAEEIIGAVLQSSTEPCLLGWLRAFSPDVTQPSFAASVLRCLGRLAEPGTSRWRAELVGAALAIEEFGDSRRCGASGRVVERPGTDRPSRVPFRAGDMASRLCSRRHRRPQSVNGHP
jgi:hypothetical protein